MEISYSSRIQKKYYGFLFDTKPHFDSVTPHVTPSDGVLDMRDLQRGEGGEGFVGFGIYGSPMDVGSKPITQRFDLSNWYRFQKPGRYSVTVTSREVWWV